MTVRAALVIACEARRVEGDGSNQYVRKGGGKSHEVLTKAQAQERYGEMMARLGARVDGVQDLSAIGQPPQLVYTDGQTGTTLMDPLSKVTPDRVAARLHQKRKSWKVGPAAEVEAELVTGDGSNQYVQKGGGAEQGAGAPGNVRFSGDKYQKDVTVGGVKVGRLVRKIRGSGLDFHPDADGFAKLGLKGDATKTRSFAQSYDLEQFLGRAMPKKEGDGSNQYRRKGGRQKFAPAAHEPDEGVRVETPAVRAERIGAMRVDPARARVIRKALGMKEVRAALVAA